MAVPRSGDFFKVLTLFGIHFLLSDPLSSLVLKNPRARTTTSITFVFALKSPNISLAKSSHPYCFPFSLLSRLLSPGTAMSRRGLCCCSYHGQLHVCQAQGKISWYFHFFILSYPCRAMLVPLATKFQMNNPGQCVVPLHTSYLQYSSPATSELCEQTFHIGLFLSSCFVSPLSFSSCSPKDSLLQQTPSLLKPSAASTLCYSSGSHARIWTPP